MDPETREYYERLLDMFATKGWDEFVKDQRDAFAHLKNISHVDCDTNDKWQQRRGELFNIEKLINFELSIKNSYDNLEKESTLEVESNEYDPLH